MHENYGHAAGDNTNARCKGKGEVGETCRMDNSFLSSFAKSAHGARYCCSSDKYALSGRSLNTPCLQHDRNKETRQSE